MPRHDDNLRCAEATGKRGMRNMRRGRRGGDAGLRAVALAKA
jgi:hypothetical protein